MNWRVVSCFGWLLSVSDMLSVEVENNESASVATDFDRAFDAYEQLKCLPCISKFQLEHHCLPTFPPVQHPLPPHAPSQQTTNGRETADRSFSDYHFFIGLKISTSPNLVFVSNDRSDHEKYFQSFVEEFSLAKGEVPWKPRFFAYLAHADQLLTY